jgi:PHD/YefM family antitoxin component YafN of YafNO toxin-antitoxin module
MATQSQADVHVQLSDVESNLEALVDAIARGSSRVIIEREGLPVGALVSTADLEVLARVDREREELFALIDRLREAFKDVPPDEIEQETDRILARNRAAIRAAREPLATSR